MTHDFGADDSTAAHRAGTFSVSWGGGGVVGRKVVSREVGGLGIARIVGISLQHTS
jgi:hypothetical protein